MTLSTLVTAEEVIVKPLYAFSDEEEEEKEAGGDADDFGDDDDEEDLDGFEIEGDDDLAEDGEVA